MTFSNLEQQLLSLPEPDRIHMIEVLWDSLLPGDAANRVGKWNAEAERRVDAVEAGQLSLMDAEQVFKEIRENIG